MSFIGYVRRAVFVAVVCAGVVTALVLGAVALTITGGDGARVLGLDVLAWAVVAPVAGVFLAAPIGMLALHSIIRRRNRGLAFIDAQVEAIRRGAGALPRPKVGLSDIDSHTQGLARLAGELAQQRALDRDFASDASHQLRTPLTALLMRLEEMGETDDMDVVREEAAVAVTQVERLTGVIDTLLARSKGEEGVVPEISLDSVLAALQREYQPAFTAARRTMRVDGPPGLAVRSSPADLGQILQTLIENSLAHGDGRVTITMRASAGSTVIEVQDEGEGIPAAIAPHVFERSVTSHGSGLGLGLARQLAERNGGRLELVSSHPAVFSVFLAGRGIR
ncbi:sensor histidine kinase [Janibacter corallicola]|uniref:sensor histidine kinase n=1 Tax=Janibacter corallicola TaxID=415212 RepID=UPI000A8EE3D2|nr:HAMP domain-containing sensor histidine kinase [Janibacter corallicola]